MLALAQRKGVLRPRDLDAPGMPSEHLRRLHAEGLLLHPGRGLYVPADARPTENQSLVGAWCKRVPRGVVCLLSALQFHGLTTQAPFEVWMAVGAEGVGAPRRLSAAPDCPLLRIGPDQRP